MDAPSSPATARAVSSVRREAADEPPDHDGSRTSVAVRGDLALLVFVVVLASWLLMPFALRGQPHQDLVPYLVSGEFVGVQPDDAGDPVAGELARFESHLDLQFFGVHRDHATAQKISVLRANQLCGRAGLLHSWERQQTFALRVVHPHPARVVEGELDGLDLDTRGPITRELVAALKGQRLGVGVWTVDLPERACELIAAGVEGLTTNRPGWLRGQLRL